MPDEVTDGEAVETTADFDTSGNEYDEGTGFEGSGETEGTEGTEGTEADPWAAYGGKDAVDQAVRLHQAVQTEDGIFQLFFEAGQSLGLGLKEMQTLFGQGDAQPEAEGPADDELVTWAQARELLHREVLQPMQAQQQAVAETVARQSVQSTISELGITDNETVAAVLQLGDRYLPPGSMDPREISAAVKRGHEDFVKLVQANAQKYVAGKAAARKSVPKPLGGGASSAEAPAEAEPKTVAEAIAAARKRLGVR